MQMTNQIATRPMMGPFGGPSIIIGGGPMIGGPGPFGMGMPMMMGGPQ